MKTQRLLVLCLLVAGAVCLRSQNSIVPDPKVEARAQELLGKLSLEEKIDLIAGYQGMSIRPEPKLGMPQLKMSDGPVGVHPWGATTAFTGGVALAAAWDTGLAHRVGVGLGQDARARGVNFVLGPGVNIYRAPMNGRNFEYFGEDPYLAARTTVGYIEGLQSQGVSATVKHFALNNQEYDRHNVSSDASERAMREIYLPAFEAAVREAHTGAVMNSYNLINGIHATQNDWLNNQVLKKDWGFDGILMSDWASTYDGVAAANGGLDLEMPNPDFMNRKTLLPAVQQGKVSMHVIDDKVRRILRTAIRFGFLDRPQEDDSISLLNPEARQTALDEARESITLLKNEHNLLPFDPANVRTIALIGPDAWPAIVGGGGSSNTKAFEPVSLLEGLSREAGVKVLYAPGLPSMQDLFDQTQFEPADPKNADKDDEGPVKVETFSNETFSGAVAAISYVDKISTWRPLVWTAGVSTNKSIRYSAKFVPQRSGRHLFLVAATASDAYRLYVDGKKVLDQVSRESQAPQSVELELKQGTPVAFRLDYLPGANEQRISMGIRAIEDLIDSRSLAIAAQADAAVVSVGFDANTESEGFDRPYTLPYGQDALISAVAKANRNTVVALTAGGEIDTRRWLGDVPAFLHLWYPGQEGGKALAEILMGERSPEGKLPISFAASWEDNPVQDHYYPPADDKKSNPHVQYAEGVFLGYRYYTSRNKPVLFPFGFGLSYTTFDLHGLNVSPASIASSADPVTVSVDVTNTGARAGAEVVQLYLGDPSAKVERPSKELKGFAKVRLDPGQTQHVTFTVKARDLCYWDEQGHRWKVDPGLFKVYVGNSSQNTPLTGEFMLGAE